METVARFAGNDKGGCRNFRVASNMSAPFQVALYNVLPSLSSIVVKGTSMPLFAWYVPLVFTGIIVTTA